MIIDDVKTFILGLNLGNLPAGKQEYYAINITYCVCKPKHDQNINNFSNMYIHTPVCYIMSVNTTVLEYT